MAAPADPRASPIGRPLAVGGGKGALLGGREVFRGNRRFDEMVRRTGAPRDTLTARLRTLVDAGILQRSRYSDHPQRFEYGLTTAGRDLYPVILTLLRWGDEHRAGPEGPPLVLDHSCGHRRVPEVTCQACGEVVDPAETTRRSPTST